MGSDRSVIPEGGKRASGADIAARAPLLQGRVILERFSFSVIPERLLFLVIPEAPKALSGTHGRRLTSIALLSTVLCFFIFLAGCATTQPPTPHDYSEATIPELHAQMRDGALTAEALTEWYLHRIETIDRAGPALNAIIEVNPDALRIARSLDRKWRESGAQGPLHGIPVVLKANIDTGDKMATSAGSLALADHHAPDDAHLVARLRAAGAVILGKANLSEWANFRSSHSSSGWSSLGGQTTRRNPCGSSSGSAVAVAANLATLAIGTETDGSVVCPAGLNGVVGIKPSLGLVSRDGIIPIAHSQDTAGPMARTVRDAATLLAVMAGSDLEDPITVNAPKLAPAFIDNLSPEALRGKRIGVLRSHYGAGGNPDVEAVLDASIDVLTARGARVVDDIEIDIDEAGDAEYEVLLYEFKADLNKYLRDSGAPYGSLEALIAFNEENADTVMPIFGQDVFLEAQEKGPLSEQAYLEALETSKRITQEGIDGALAEHDLDAMIAPTNGPAWLTDHILGDRFDVSSSSYAAVSGYANITVPAGFVSGLPIGLSFIGANFSDAELIEMAYAFEQATQARRPPEMQ